MNWRVWIPLMMFASFVGLAGFMLTQPKNEFVASEMVGRELPYFALPAAVDGKRGLASAGFADGRPRLLNIWASWCVPCVAEAPQLARLKAEGAEIVGVAIRDRPEAIAGFLARHGDPYVAVGRDDLSEVQLGIGSSGVPETFVIDGKGRIAYQHIGEIRPEHIALLLDKLDAAR